MGFARAERLEPEGSRFQEWLRRGYGASMEWLSTSLGARLNPAAAFGARTVVVMAMPYEAVQAEPGPGEGRVSRYARGRDYHNLLGKRLRRLVRELRRRHPENETRFWVDTGPVLEKAWAQRAGVGFVGKNTLLIRPDEGSYHFLGVILTSLALEPSEPAVEQCGGCTLCLEACPTRAFPEPFVLDSRRCVSYQTIEERGGVPAELRQEIGDRVFGCDVCQDICPFNREAAACSEPDFQHGPEHELLDELLVLSDALFVERFRGRALKRARREGLARNAAIVAGNRRDTDQVACLGAALRGDPSALVRGSAAWALGQIGGAAAKRILETVRSRETDAEVLTAVREALSRLASADSS